MVGLEHRPDHRAEGHHAIEQRTGVERQVQRVDEQQFDRTGQGDEPGYQAVEHKQQDAERNQQGADGAPKGVFFEFAEIIDQHDGRDGQQVEQVDADGDTHQVGDPDEVTVAAGLVGVVFPFENQPKDNRSQKRRVGIWSITVPLSVLMLK